MSKAIESIKDNLIPFTSFQYWFIPIRRGQFNIIRLEDNHSFSDGSEHVVMYTSGPAKKLSHEDKVSIDEVSSIYQDFEKYKLRPEYAMVCTEPSNYLEDVVTMYNTKLVGCLLARAYAERPWENPDDRGLRIANSILSWLETTDFYRAPASTRYHDHYEGGLITHTLTVANNMIDLLNLSKFSNVDVHRAIFTALVHDWCKIELYESYMRNVKDSTGQWVQEKNFKWRESGPTFAFGHGVSSMFLVSRFVNLTADEAAAIRWHMGAFNVASNEITDMQTCNERYPLVLMLQFADHLSITRY